MLIRARFSLANNADNVFVPFVVFLAVVMGGQGRSEDYAFGGVHDSIFPTKWAWFVLNHAHFDVVYFIVTCVLT